MKPQESNDSMDKPVFRFDPSIEIDPIALVDNASLALHHHMAPPDEDDRKA